MSKGFRWRGAEAKALARKVAMQALHDGAEVILTEAVDEAPVESGTLRRSGTVTDAPSRDAVYISFNTPYAVRQHEELDYQHPRGGKAKYLEDPFNRLKGTVKKLAELRVKKALRDAR